DDVEPVGDLLPDRFAGIQRVARLVDIAELHRLADPQAPAVRRLLANDHAEQRGLAGAVRADHADDAAGRQAEVETVDQQAVAEALAQLLGDDHQLAQARTGRDADLATIGLLLTARRQQLLIGGDARLALGLAGPRRLADPFQFMLKRALAGR